MNLKQLEVVAQVAKHGSLSRAAIALGLAQSIVSRQINQLESQWGARLFERTGRGMVLSDFGRLVFPELQALLEQAQRLEELVQKAASHAIGVVKIGVISSLVNPIVPALIKDLSICAPNVKLAVTETSSALLDELLLSGRIDLAVVNRFSTVAEGDEDFLGEITTYLVCSTQHKYAQRSIIPFADLFDLPLVLPAAPSGLRNILQHHAKRLGLNLKVFLEAESLFTMKSVAISGEAMTILPLCAVREEVASGELAIIKIVSPELPRKIRLACTQQHALSQAARLVMARLNHLVPSLLLEPDSCSAETQRAS